MNTLPLSKVAKEVTKKKERSNDKDFSIISGTYLNLFNANRRE